MSFGANPARAASPGADLAWDPGELAGMAARFVDAGGLVAEIDGLTSSALGAGRGGLPVRRVVAPPFDYVRAILAGGLDVEGEGAERLAAASVAGAADFDYAPTVGLFDPRFNARAERRVRVRTLDRLLENLLQPILLVFGGCGLRADILRAGRGAVAGRLPVVVARPDSVDDLEAFAVALREIEPSYGWITPPGGRADLAGPRPYHVAAARGGGASETFASIARGGKRLETLGGPAAALGALRAPPNAFVASRGFYPTESDGGDVWRWGGVLPRLSVLLEAPTPGLYEIRIALGGAVAGAAESVEGIKVNGALLTNVVRQTAQAFAVTARLARPVLLEIDCPVRRIVPPDSRLLNISLTEIALSQIAT